MKPKGFWSWFWLVLALGIGLLAAFCAFLAVDLEWRSAKCRAAELFRLPVDLSRTNTIEASFIGDCPFSHGINLHLEIQPSITNTEEARLMFKGLTGVITYSNALTGDVEPFELESHIPTHLGIDGPRIHFATVSVLSGRDGNYALKITPRTVLPRLHGREQTLVGQYSICGCERMGTLYLGFFAVLGGVISFGSSCAYRSLGARQRPS